MSGRVYVALLRRVHYAGAGEAPGARCLSATRGGRMSNEPLRVVCAPKSMVNLFCAPSACPSSSFEVAGD